MSKGTRKRTRCEEKDLLALCRRGTRGECDLFLFYFLFIVIPILIFILILLDLIVVVVVVVVIVVIVVVVVLIVRLGLVKASKLGSSPLRGR